MSFFTISVSLSYFTISISFYTIFVSLAINLSLHLWQVVPHKCCVFSSSVKFISCLEKLAKLSRIYFFFFFFGLFNKYINKILSSAKISQLKHLPNNKHLMTKLLLLGCKFLLYLINPFYFLAIQVLVQYHIIAHFILKIIKKITC